MSKYHAKPVTDNGKRFASKAEHKRYRELLLLERSGQIRALQCHPKYPLHVNGQHVCTYIGDFSFIERNKAVCVDVKGVPTAVFRLKAKMFRAEYPDIELRVEKA